METHQSLFTVFTANYITAYWQTTNDISSLVKFEIVIRACLFDSFTFFPCKNLSI